MLGLALTFAALAAAASATGYIDGREYVYRYVGNIYTGYPGIKPQYSGYIFYANVVIQPKGDYALFKVDDVKKAQFHGEFENVFHHPYEYVDLPEHSAFLTQPFKVYRKNGIVTHFEVGRDDPSFSVNLKRGLVGLFNLNFDHVEGSSFEDNEILKPDPDAHYYKVYEDGILGECETAYVIEHHPYEKTPHNNIVLNVTKVKNYHKCNTRPNQVYATFHGHECGQAEHEKSHTLHGNGHYHYDIRGDRHHYVIEKIRTEGEVIYQPYPTKGESVVNRINRKLELVEEREVSTPLEVGDDLITHNSLVYQFDFQKDFKDPVDLKKPHYLYFLTGRKVPISDIRNQVEELVVVYTDDTYTEKFKEKNFPAKFVELLRSVATLGYNEIDDLYKAYADIPKSGATPQQKRYRNLFIDVLVNLGTNPAVLYGKHLIETKRVRPQEAMYFVQQLPFHLKDVSETLLDNLQELCISENVKKNPSLHVACIMSLSNIVFDRCVAQYHPEGKIPQGKNVCPQEAAIKYFTFIARLYDNTSHEKLKSAYLTAAGNIGIKEIIPYVRPYIEGEGNTPVYYRSPAIWALKNVGHRYPDKVRDLLVPVLFNRSENYELRLSAFIMLLQFRPQLYEVEGLARALKEDPDDQVRSYVYSTFKGLANSTHPCDRTLSEYAQQAVKILEAGHNQFEHYDYSYSKHHYVGGFDNDYDFGGSTRFAYFASDTGYIPRGIYLGLEDFLGGKSFYTMSVGLRQNGLEKFVDKLLGPEGSFGRRSLFDLFKKRGKRDVSGVEKELNEIKSKLNLPVREYDPIQGELFFMYMGNHLSAIPFDDKTFESFFKEGRFTIPNLPAAYQKLPEFYYQRFMLTVDKFYVIPSESGIPIFFDYKQPVYYYHHNKEASFKVEPGFFPEDRGGKWPDNVKAEMDGHLAVDKNLFAYMGVVIPFDQVIFGAGINRRATLSLPLKLKLDLVVKEKKLKTEWTPVAPHEVYHFKYEPYTFIESYMDSVPQVLEKEYRPVKRVHRHEETRKYLYDAFGVGFDVKADYENEFNDLGSWFDFFLEKDYRQKFYYLYANPHFERYNVDVIFNYADKDATKKVETEFTYKFYDEDYITPRFLEEGFEDLDRHKEDRGPLCTCALEAEMTATGDKERKIKGELTWTRDLKRTFHKVNFYYDRTPFASYETDNLKVCGSSYLKYPKYDLIKLATLNTLDMDHTVKGEVKMNFGKNCNSHQKVKVKGLFETSEQQRDFERRREEPDEPEHYNEYSHYYHGCQVERSRGINYGENCMRYIELTTTVHKHNFHIKYENLSNRFLNFTYRVAGFMKHALYNHGEHNFIGVDNPDGEVHIVANFSSKLPVGDIRVIKPKAESLYYNVYMPRYSGLRSYRDYEDIHIKNSYSDLHCRIEGDEVYTFDKFEYTLPPIDCYKVIARDCSPNEHFTILGTKISHPKYHKAVKIFLGEHKIEALPVSDESDIIIRIDGKRVPVTGSEPYLHKEEGEDLPIFYVTFRDFYYALHSEKYGLIVEYDGHAIRIQVSPFYRSKMCGICGNYNGQKFDGYITPDGCYYEDESAYAYAYAIPSDTCTIPEIKKRCPAEGGFGCTKLSTHVLQLTTGKVPQTCFSIEPISECAAHCSSPGTISRKVSYHCLPAKDDSTKALLRDQQTRVLFELRRKSKDHEATVEVPDGCYRN